MSPISGTLISSVNFVGPCVLIFRKRKIRPTIYNFCEQHILSIYTDMYMYRFVYTYTCTSTYMYKCVCVLCAHILCKNGCQEFCYKNPLGIWGPLEISDCERGLIVCSRGGEGFLGKSSPNQLGTLETLRVKLRQK